MYLKINFIYSQGNKKKENVFFYPCLMAQSTLASRIRVSPSTWLLVHPAGHREEMCAAASLSGSPNEEPSDHTAELEHIRT